MVEVTKIGNKTLVMDGKILSLFRRGSLLRQMYYGGYEDFDGANGGVWKKYINIPIKTVPLEYAQYLIEIDDTNVSVYNVERTLKAQASIASEFWSLVRSDGKDIRAFDHLFNQLWFWVEMFDYTNKKAKIWVRLPEGSKELNIAFGNEKASESSYNNGDETFEFFDDFLGADLDTTKWQTFGTFDILEVTNGELHVKATQGNALVVSKSTLNRNIVIEDRARLISREISQAYLVQDIDNWMISGYWYFNTWVQTIRKRVSGTVYVLADDNKALSYNTYYFRRTILKESDIIYELYDDNENLITTLTASDTTFSSGYVGFRIYGKSDFPSEFYADWIKVLKLADPATFTTPRIIEF